MTASPAHHVLGRDARAAALVLAVVVALAAVALVVLALAAGSDAFVPTDTLAPAAPGRSPASPETVAA